MSPTIDWRLRTLMAERGMFQTTDLGSGYMVASLGDHKAGEHKCGEAKCGEAKCGADKK